MKLMRFNPEWSIPGYLDFFNSVFDRSSDELFHWKADTWSPAVNVLEAKDKYNIEVVAPGVKKEDFKVEVHNDVLTVASGKKEENVKEDEQFTRKEYCYSSFSRSFRLPESVNSDEIAAKYEDGILKISLPKNEVTKDKRPKAIAVR